MTWAEIASHDRTSADAGDEHNIFILFILHLILPHWRTSPQNLFLLQVQLSSPTLPIFHFESLLWRAGMSAEHVESKKNIPPVSTSYPACVKLRTSSALAPTLVFLPKIHPSSFALDDEYALVEVVDVKNTGLHPSPTTQWSDSTHPTTRDILPITQCRPITERVIVARSPLFVEFPIIESDEMRDFASIRARLSGSVGIA